MRIAGHEFANGVGLQADNRSAVELNGAGQFTAPTGIDDATESDSPIVLEIIADGQSLWRREMNSFPACALLFFFSR